MGAWSPSLDRDLDPMIEWNGLVLLMPGAQAGRVFWGTQLGYIGLRITVFVRRYDLAMV